MKQTLAIIGFAALAAGSAQGQTGSGQSVIGQWCPENGPVFYLEPRGVGWGDSTVCETVPAPSEGAQAYHARLECTQFHATGETDADGNPEYHETHIDEISEIVALALPDGRLALYLDDGLGTDILTRCE